MDRLWTPWRMTYVSGTTQPIVDCVMCDLAAAASDKERLVLRRGNRAFMVLNLYPYNTGHIMVAPYQHGGDLNELAPEAGAEIWSLTGLAVRALAAEYHPDGYNVGMNLGRVAGAGVPDHLHVHIVPRWSGDTNFMPVTADTKVLPESLERTWERLTRALAELP